jgi:hypothetical protein
VQTPEAWKKSKKATRKKLKNSHEYQLRRASSLAEPKVHAHPERFHEYDDEGRLVHNGKEAYDTHECRGYEGTEDGVSVFSVQCISVSVYTYGAYECMRVCNVDYVDGMSGIRIWVNGWMGGW